MKKKQLKNIKQYSKVALIISCVFAVAASALIAVSIYGLPQAVKGRQEMKYLYENGVEVDAYIKSYYNDYNPSSHGSVTAHYHIIFEYIDDNNYSYKDEYFDTVACKTKVERDEREQDIKQMMLDGKTMKMLIADNGLCCLSVYKESLLRPTTIIVYSVILSVSSVVLGLCIFGVVRHSKTLRRFRRK
ncbi:MAG: hypothetical protein K2H30_02635 [Clostridia bacterium]|nr:hypothetical protein [Clostridia bacterium]